MKYIASCSFGKDSMATVLLAKMHNEPLDEVIFSEVMFDAETSGEHPIHINWVYQKAIPEIEKMGYKVKVLRSETNYMSHFFHVCGNRSKESRRGKLQGFPIPFQCKINQMCKMKPIKDYLKSQKDEIIQYVGIALDEQKRLARIRESKNKISLLEKYSYTEKMAKDLCDYHDLLSPVYRYQSRNGCWFCPNQTIEQLRLIYRNHRELWEKLKNLSNVQNKVSEKFNRLYTFDEMEEKIIEREKI